MEFDINIRKQNILPAVTPPRGKAIKAPPRGKSQEPWN